MKKIVSLLMVLLLLAVPALAMAAEGYLDARECVVRMLVIGTYSTGEQALWTGSAFAVGEKKGAAQYFVTNHHVTGYLGETDETGLGRLESVEMYIVFDDTSNMRLCTLIGTHDYADLAVVRTNSPITERKTARFAKKDLDLANFGEDVHTLGFPSVADVYMSASDSLPSAPKQVVVGTGKVQRFLLRAEHDGVEFIQTNADMNSGNSGGPLVTEEGYVIGVNTNSISGSDSYNGAICFTEVLKMLDKYEVPYEVAGGFSFMDVSPVTLAVAALLIAAIVIVLVVLLKQNKESKSEPKDGNTVGNPATRRLKAECGALAGKSFVLEIGKPVTIGRDPESCDILFPEDTKKVSRKHCTLLFDGNKVVVTDNRSTCGTMLNGEQIPGGGSKTFHRGQVLSIGSDNEQFTLHN